MGGVTGVTGGGGVYQPSGPSQDPFALFIAELSAFLDNPSHESLNTLTQTINNLENSNITPKQKETLQNIQSQLAPYLGNAERIAYLHTQPQTPETITEEQLLQAVQNQNLGMMLDEAGRLT